MAFVLLATGFVLLARFNTSLDRTINDDLRLRARDVAAIVVESARAGDVPAVDRSRGRFVQVLDARNDVVVGSPELGRRSILDDQALRRARARPVIFERDLDSGVRFYAREAGPDATVVVGASLDAHRDARAALSRLLLLSAPVALVFAGLVGYLVALVALRPVDAMRRKAQRITATAVDERLPVPPVNDELAALGRTLNHMLDRLDDALGRERTLVADASHELRTPLAIVQAELELALKPGRPREELEDALRSVAEETERLVRLCDDLLLLARADRRELRLDQRAMRVDDVLGQAADRARRTHGDVVQLVAPAPAPEISVDPLRIEQALANLVGNAFKYGAKTVTLTADAGRDGVVELHVLDDGPGFPDEFLDRAFDRFSRAEQARSRGGTGLGLSIVAAIAEAHGGRAGVRNRPEGGADAWLAIPRRA